LKLWKPKAITTKDTTVREGKPEGIAADSLARHHV